MPFAAVMYVDLSGRDRAAGDQMLDERLIPMLKALPGFRAARFLRSLDGTTGVSAVIFDSEDQARASLSSERAPDAPPIKSSELYEVHREV